MLYIAAYIYTIRRMVCHETYLVGRRKIGLLLKLMTFFTFWMYLTKKQLLVSLPDFVARKPDHIPPFRTDELDMRMAMQLISALEEKLSFVMSQRTQLSSMVADVKAIMSDTFSAPASRYANC